MKSSPPDPVAPANQTKLWMALRRLRAEARCINELERAHLLWRLGQELGLTAAELHHGGFESAFRRIVEEED